MTAKQRAKEEWRQVCGYEKYFVSNLGQIKSFTSKAGRDGKILKPGISTGGYYAVSIGNPPKSIRLHRLIAKAFVSNPENKPQVNHINGIKTDNRAENLEWVTARENVRHGFDIGLFKKKITNEQIEEMKRMWESGMCWQEIDRVMGLTIGVTRYFLMVKLGITKRNSRPKIGRTSKYRGVSWNKLGRRWIVQISHQGRHYYFGRFTDEKDAAKKYNEEIVKLYGNDVSLNNLCEQIALNPQR